MMTFNAIERESLLPRGKMPCHTGVKGSIEVSQGRNERKPKSEPLVRFLEECQGRAE